MMTIHRAVEVLSEASRGNMTIDAEFKVACAMGKQALIKVAVDAVYSTELSPLYKKP